VVGATLAAVQGSGMRLNRCRILSDRCLAYRREMLAGLQLMARTVASFISSGPMGAFIRAFIPPTPTLIVSKNIAGDIINTTTTTRGVS
jgi:hypothetical protein